MKFRLKQWIKHYFGFTKTETNAVVVLVPLLVLIILSPKFYSAWFRVDYQNYEHDAVLLDSLVASVKESVSPNVLVPPSKPEEFLFNPNVVSADSLRLLGVPGFIADRIENYRSKGGQFRVKADLKKIYDFPDSTYNRLEQFILLPDKVTARVEKKATPKAPKPDVEIEVNTPEKKAEEFLVVNIASADSMSLRALRGIGPAYARRIVKYRDLLGGFYHVEQLREVYGLSDSLFVALQPHLICEDYQLKKLAINLATFKQLNAHPYISYQQAGDILNTKSKNGKFTNANDLLKVETFDSTQVVKLLPYLDFR
ncbi:ComEA family DNA-binding protein [Roseivirga pacifica]|uniref:ComEA family DNA-binding protein n=1 Tax=Roseivirga pacifica TaxID=1267423 RepID=UPI003BAFFB4B